MLLVDYNLCFCYETFVNFLAQYSVTNLVNALIRKKDIAADFRYF